VVKITLFRGGKYLEIKATLGDRRVLLKGDGQEGEGQEDETPRSGRRGSGALDLERLYGFTVEALSPANRRQYGVPGDWGGVVVTSVSPRSAAMDKGLREGLVISAIGTQDVADLQDFFQEVRKLGGRKPLLVLVRVPRTDAQATLAIPPR